MQPAARGLIALCLVGGLSACSSPSNEPPAGETAKSAVKPALTVQAIRPSQEDWPRTLSASGNISAWQEAVIGAELGGYRITEVLAQVGDKVHKGQVLARIASDTVDQEWAESSASVAEAEATLAEARANVERARQLRDKGFYSPQQNTREQTSADTAQARLKAAQARQASVALRRSKSTVLAPDSGLISARSATVGSLSENGKELFRLIRGGRLEWRAEVSAQDLPQMKIGQNARLTVGNASPLTGTVRRIAPTADPQTRLALVYVDLPPEATSRLAAGMFARGTFELGMQPAVTLPQSAVLLRDGFAYVFKTVASAEGSRSDGLSKVSQIKIRTGRQQGERLEILDLPANTAVVEKGVGFLADGDTVTLVRPE